MSPRPLVAVVLAAGQGTRMKSSLPKVLHDANGRPLLRWVLDAVAGAHPDEILVVVGHGADAVRNALADWELGVKVRTVLQPEQRGTGDAMRCALDALEPAERDLLVLPGDMPLIEPATLRAMREVHDDDDTALTVLTAHFADPTGYGRIVRGLGGGIAKIVEHRDCLPDQLTIDEVAVSTYVFDETRLREVIGRLSTDNAQGELYLTDAVEAIFPDVDTVTAPAGTVVGVNDRVQLAEVEGALRTRIAEFWMREGVTVRDPSTVWIGADVTLAPDVTLLPGVHLEGTTSVGAGSTLGPDVRCVDARIGERVTLTYCVIRDTAIADDADCGPYVSLRGGCDVGPGAHVGTFVEMKKTSLGAGAKVPHLSYLGDATVGEQANIGANTITCNWDGAAKHPTTIGRGVRTGSGSLLVAPVELGDRAFTGAGAVVTHDVPPGALAKGLPARNVEGWTDQHRPNTPG